MKETPLRIELLRGRLLKDLFSYRLHPLAEKLTTKYLNGDAEAVNHLMNLMSPVSVKLTIEAIEYAKK